MLDMGFEPQIRKIICNGVPPTRQTLFYTATWPHNVRSLAEEFLRFPVQVEVGDINQLIPYKNITQYVHVIRSHGDKQQSDKQQQQPGSRRSRLQCQRQGRYVLSSLLVTPPASAGSTAPPGLTMWQRACHLHMMSVSNSFT